MAEKFSDLYAFDLDGTLVHSLEPESRGIPLELIEIMQLISSRAHLVIATGRPFRSALNDIHVLPKMPYVIVHNGLVIKDTHGKTLERNAISPEEALPVAQFIRAQGFDPVIVVDGFEQSIDVMFEGPRISTSEYLQSFDVQTRNRNFHLDSFDSVDVFPQIPLLEVAAFGPYEDLKKLKVALSQILPADLRIIIVKNIGYQKHSALEVFRKDCSKATGVRKVRKLLKARRVIAVGDDENDIEMIRDADIGIVMDHAEPHVKEASAIHVQGPKGLAAYLRKLVS